METHLTEAEMAALRGVDGGLMQKRLDPDMEERLTELGLIERVKLSGTPSRTAKGDRLARGGR